MTKSLLTLTDDQARELHTLASDVMRDLRVGMPDSGAIRLDILKPAERLAYDLARQVLLDVAPAVLRRVPGAGPELIHAASCPRSGWKAGRTDGLCGCPAGFPRYADEVR